MDQSTGILRLLIVEDDGGDKLAVHHAVNAGKQAVELIEVAGLEDAVDAVLSGGVDCVLVDYELPDGAALALLERLRSIRDSPPAIALTAMDDDGVALEALRLGAQDYLLRSQLDGRSLWRAIRYAVQRQEVQRLRDRLEYTQRLGAIGQLAAGVAHEINNPACYVLANLGFVRESLAEIRGLATGELAKSLVETDEAIADCIQGTERICKIVRELRPFAQIERGGLEPIDFNQIVESAINLTRSEIGHRAQLVRRLGELPRVVGDRARLCQVVVNLIANAIQAIEPGAADRNTITVTTALWGSQLVLSVSDTGSGIDASVRDRIFEPFFTTKDRTVGTGLGLAIAAETVRKHNGTIEFESAAGRGTTFTVCIPRNTGLINDLPPVPVALSAARSRVLLVDDDRMVRSGLRRLLMPPHQVTEADGGAAALEMLDASDFDVIICDLMMPEVDGLAVYDQLARDRPELVDRIIFLTGGAFTQRARSFVSRVGAVVLEKPVSRARLLEAVDKISGSLL